MEAEVKDVLDMLRVACSSCVLDRDSISCHYCTSYRAAQLIEGLSKELEDVRGYTEGGVYDS